MTDLDIDPLDLVLPERYGLGAFPHEAWARLRAEDPVHWCEPEGYRPFWAITKHADIKAVSSQPELFSSVPRLALQPIAYEEKMLEVFPDAADQGGQPLRMLVTMDPPDHRAYRNLAGPYFRPRVLKALEDRVAEVTTLLLDRYAGTDVELDFVTDVASLHPLRMICEILGVARADEHVILQLTNELFAAEDPEFARDDKLAIIPDLFDFFFELVEEKRAAPGEDLASVLANGEIDGQPLPHVELLSYFVLVATAGHDTTRNALSGGLQALIDHPEELAKLRADPSLAKSAADELVRWTSPVIHFIRTATADTELGGKQIRAGDNLCLYYPSANRDEAVFDDPFAFRVDRDPNPHLGFGVGEHFCLGASLARMELRTFLEAFASRIGSVELAGEPLRTHASFVGGYKHLPIRWTLT
ncbi:cytochrome P450 [Aquihabitans sp. G128]|uniref:cytochrome P450 n=1 Tax=Aquihabitans sp. G128 TaxID=2849779 RepID=UPI001C2251E6|nr:cytochrome P450 [Aquihabitans sp. G128]QXC59973.1 cytochrome P450 [Aquihabitans sp. G128]